ncbi:MAG TPA: hypothetical protein VMN58_05425 [Acidimicrobiales bacterium]|nr:hypothetical protein [Acidimicrobiales bacterium]
MSDQTDQTDQTTGQRGPSLAGVGAFVGQLGGKLGIGVSVLGFIVIFLGWNGAASFNDLRQQFPYLVSGGIAGLGLVTIGAALLIVENSRKERVELTLALAELTRAVEAMGSPTTNGAGADPPMLSVAPGQVVAGASSYHRPECRLAQGQADAEGIDPSEALEQGLAPCRICTPPTGDVTGEVAVVDDDTPRRRQLKAK